MTSSKTAVLVQSCALDHRNDVRDLLLRCGWTAGALPPTASGYAFVALTEGGVVGYARIITDCATVSYLCELAVDAGWRGQGVGRALIDACVAVYPSARLDVLSTEMALGFYEGCGFTPKSGYRRWPQS